MQSNCTPSPCATCGNPRVAYIIRTGDHAGQVRTYCPPCRVAENRRRRNGELIANRCACGCGQVPKPGSRFLRGHNAGRANTDARCPSCSGLPSSWRSRPCRDVFHDENRANRRDGRIAERIRHRDARIAQQRRRYVSDPSVRARAVQRSIEWNGRNPDRVRIMSRAHSAVASAIKQGKLTRPTTCEQCGTTGTAIEAAHADYSRRLDVRWLCRRCHRRWDRLEPKTLS